MHTSGGPRSTPQVRSSVTMLVLIVLVGGAAWFGWRTVTQGSPQTRTVAACPVPSQTPGAASVRPQDVRVNVYNATVKPGLGSRTAADLTARGFKVLATDNDPVKKQVPHSAEVRSSQQQQAAAALVAAQVPGAKIVFDDRADDTVDLVIGEAFQALAVRQTGEPQPPPTPAAPGQPAPTPTATAPTC